MIVFKKYIKHDIGKHASSIENNENSNAELGRFN